MAGGFCGTVVGLCGAGVVAPFVEVGGAVAAPLASIAGGGASIAEAGASKPSGSIPDASSSSTSAGAKIDAAFESEYVDQ